MYETAKIERMSLCLIATGVMAVFTTSTAACDQGSENFADSSSPETPPPASPFPTVARQSTPSSGPALPASATPTPAPLPRLTQTPVAIQGLQTAHQRLLLWEYDIRNDSAIQSKLPESARVSLDYVRDLVVLWVKCERDRSVVEQVLRERLPILGIPSDAIVVELSGGFTGVTLGWAPPPRFDCVPPEVVDPITGVSAPGFGGLHFEPEIATIHLLDPLQEAGEMLVFDELGRDRFSALREVRVLKADYTWEQLMEWYEAIKGERGMCNARPDPRNNRIAVEARGSANDNLETEIKEMLSKLAIPREAVIFVEDFD